MEPELSKNALKVLERRYLKKDGSGNVSESPSEMFRRVAKTVARVDLGYGFPADAVGRIEDAFYEAMVRLEFLPNSPTLMNAGRPLGQLSACFVLPIEDSMESIFDTLKHAAVIHKSGGGTGFSFSRLREANSPVKATGGVASGPVSFLKVYDGATQAVKQGGTRRGANMGILRVDHPDILEFITCKEQDRQISNFNLSVAVTDAFLKALESNEDYDLVSPHTGKAVRRLNSKMVFDLIVQSAHRNGEPGVIFIDRVNQCNPTPKLGAFEATNPCGEQPLLPYESCNLGSINLLKMLRKEEGRYQIDWDRLRRTVHLAVHFLDNVIDANHHPIPEIERRTKLTRKIGLGVMGWASMLCRMGVPYDDPLAVDLAGKLMSFIRAEARLKSVALAKAKGVFPAFADSIYADQGDPLRLRNATLTTIAPTGTISIIGGPCSSGIEPIFAISYYRNVMDQTKLIEIDPVFEAVARERGFYSEELMRRIADDGSIRGVPEVPEDVKRVFVTAHDIAWERHIRMQAEFQKYTDNAVSKTINFPPEATEEAVRRAYRLAHESGCKGITVYRDGSRREQVLNVVKNDPAAIVGNAAEKLEYPGVLKKEDEILGESAASDAIAVLPQESGNDPLQPRPRPRVMAGSTSKIMTGCGNLYVTINNDERQKPFELFAQMGKAGGCAASQLEAIARLVSLALRSGLDPKIIMEQLRGIRCPAPSWEHGERIFSCADAISRILEKRSARRTLKAETPEPALVEVGAGAVHSPSVPKGKKNMIGVCPDCGNPLHHEEGCLKCHGCGFSKC